MDDITGFVRSFVSFFTRHVHGNSKNRKGVTLCCIQASVLPPICVGAGDVHLFIDSRGSHAFTKLR